MLVTTGAAGTVYTVQPFLDPSAGTKDSSYTDIITISQTNAPQPGMLIGNVSRTGAGAGSGKIACIVNKDFDYRVFCTGQSPTNNQYPYTTTFVVQTNRPASYVRVPKNPAVGTYDDFCIAKYGMANDGNGNAISSRTALPWTTIARGNGVAGDGGAITACQAIGPGYDLISNVEWQTVAREVETAYSNNQYLNWSNGSNTGSDYLNMGNSGLDGVYYHDTGTGSGLAADVDSNPCSGITGHPGCAANTSSDWAYKRTFQLSNGNVVWDFSGNDGPGSRTPTRVRAQTPMYPFLRGQVAFRQIWGPAGNYRR